MQCYMSSNKRSSASISCQIFLSCISCTGRLPLLHRDYKEFRALSYGLFAEFVSSIG